MKIKLKIIPSDGLVSPVGLNLMTLLPKCEVFNSLHHKRNIISQTKHYIRCSYMCKGHAVAQWLGCCATNRKVAGSIPDGVIGISH